VEAEKFQGPWLQNRISNSTCVLQILVKFVENHRKLREMQNQFCWIPGEKYYKFCYSCKSCFHIYVHSHNQKE
jgi:hypothetical protein